MKRIVLTAAIAVLAAFPAAYGLIGNASFGESVPVRIPARATLIDDRNGSDDNGGLHSTAGSPTSTSTMATSSAAPPSEDAPGTTSAPSTEDNSGPGGPAPDNSGPGNQNNDNQSTGNQGRGGGEAEP